MCFILCKEIDALENYFIVLLHYFFLSILPFRLNGQNAFVFYKKPVDFPFSVSCHILLKNEPYFACSAYILRNSITYVTLIYSNVIEALTQYYINRNKNNLPYIFVKFTSSRLFPLLNTFENVYFLLFNSKPCMGVLLFHDELINKKKYSVFML